MKFGAKLTAVMAGMVLATAVNAATTDTLDPVVDAGKQINDSAASSQKKIDKINDQILSKVQKFKSVNKEIDGLKVYNNQLQKQLDNQIAEMKQLNESIDQVSVIERQITPLMLRMIEGLEKFVALDVPFLAEERAKRITSLKEMMDRADVEVSEKFRRILEAYQVEVDYGRTIEAYSGILSVKGKERDVDFLRIGRVALIFQTRDGSESGSWDNKAKNWTELSAEHRIQITKGLRMARKQLAPDMLVLPVKAAE